LVFEENENRQQIRREDLEFRERKRG